MLRAIHKSLFYIASIVMATVAGAASPLRAQRVDSASISTHSRVAPEDSLKPPISPRRAFLYSFVVPGYSQTVLGRNKAAAAFILAEAISLAMIRESAADVREARRTENDTLVASYVDANGQPVIMRIPPFFTDVDVRARRAHVEDWIALLVANHLFAGADAFVASHLWDVPARLGLRVLPRRGETVIAFALKW